MTEGILVGIFVSLLISSYTLYGIETELEKANKLKTLELKSRGVSEKEIEDVLKQ